MQQIYFRTVAIRKCAGEGVSLRRDGGGPGRAPLRQKTHTSILHIGRKIANRGAQMCGLLAGEIGAEFLFQVIAERAERATLIVTTNLPFSEWTQVFPNPRLCKALLDRVTDRAHIIETGTESYRFRRTVEGRQKKKAS